MLTNKNRIFVITNSQTDALHKSVSFGSMDPFLTTRPIAKDAKGDRRMDKCIFPYIFFILFFWFRFVTQLLLNFDKLGDLMPKRRGSASGEMAQRGKVSKLYSTPKCCSSLLYNLLPQPGCTRQPPPFLRSNRSSLSSSSMSLSPKLFSLSLSFTHSRSPSLSITHTHSLMLTLMFIHLSWAECGVRW